MRDEKCGLCSRHVIGIKSLVLASETKLLRYFFMTCIKPTIGINIVKA